MRKIDLKGQVFGRLTVADEAGRNKFNHFLWECKCDCGNIAVVSTSNLRNGNSRSCGCLWKEIMTTHGKSYLPEYRIWVSMIQRCTNKNDKKFSYYGGRGIAVCDSWRNSFKSFYQDMGKRPVQNYTIERIDNDKGYCPENCKWASINEQNRNSRILKTTTGKRGVYWHKKAKKYCAQITANNKNIYIGLFDDLDMAVMARKEAEAKYW